jgi:hypothetical protein
MKKLVIWTLALAMLLTVVQPVLAQSVGAGTSSTEIDEVREPRLSDLGMRLNPQLGVSGFEYSGKNGGESKQKLSGGLTVEFGGAPRKMETGLLVLQTQGSTMLTLPMMAKLRVLQMRAQSWYGKFGFMPAFEISSSRKDTNNLDVIGSLGAGGRLMFDKQSDFIIEATFNRGLMDGLRGNGENYNQGFLVMAGMSFNI